MRSLVVLGAGAAAAVPNHVVLVGGNLTLDGRSVSLARYDPERRSWAAAYTSKLYADAADARAANMQAEAEAGRQVAELWCAQWGAAPGKWPCASRATPIGLG